jgi:hypothetical protein
MHYAGGPAGLVTSDNVDPTTDEGRAYWQERHDIEERREAADYDDWDWLEQDR